MYMIPLSEVIFQDFGGFGNFVLKAYRNEKRSDKYLQKVGFLLNN